MKMEIMSGSCRNHSNMRRRCNECVSFKFYNKRKKILYFGFFVLFFLLSVTILHSVKCKNSSQKVWIHVFSSFFFFCSFLSCSYGDDQKAISREKSIRNGRIHLRSRATRKIMTPVTERNQSDCRNISSISLCDAEMKNIRKKIKKSKTKIERKTIFVCVITVNSISHILFTFSSRQIIFRVSRNRLTATTKLKKLVEIIQEIMT